MTIKFKPSDKTNGFDTLYLKDVVVWYASVQKPKRKYTQPGKDDKNQSENEYSMTVFVNSEDRTTLEEEVMINKQLFEVGKDKNKKRKIKYPAKDYEEVKGLHGMQLTLNEYYNSGKPATLLVVDENGDPTDVLVGNGSRCNVKCTGYRNQDGLLNVTMQIVQITDLVEYEGGDGSIVDDELGVSVSRDEIRKSPVAKEFDRADDDDDDDDIPF